MNEQLIAAVSAYKAAADAKKQAHLNYLSAKAALQSALADCGVKLAEVMAEE